MSYQLSELQEKWLQALESGEYEQAEGVLYDGVGYCCLGIGCVVLGMRPTKCEEDGCETRYYFGTDGESEAAPAMLVEALGLHKYMGDGRKPFEIDGEVYETLAQANDHGRTFAQIAAAIRANPENFFK